MDDRSPPADHATTPTAIFKWSLAAGGLPSLPTTTLRASDQNRLPYSWFQALNATFKHRVREFFAGTESSVDAANDCNTSSTPCELIGNIAAPQSIPSRRGSPWGREVSALRAVVTELHDELRDSQARKKRARYMAFHDDLTALPNGRYFRERLGLALRGCSDSLQLAVMYVDLDGFKALNDTHGHETGDQFLTVVAQRLAHAVRAEDIVSRLSGDEYACLITGVADRSCLQRIASTLYQAVSAPFKIGALEMTVRASIGIAMYPADGTTTEALLGAADAAMYAAKRARSGTSFAASFKDNSSLRLVTVLPVL